MRYTSITLKGFKRLGFGQVKSFTLKPLQFCQLILGINGFGKSTLMKEISPLPGNKNDYYPNGEKEIIIENDHKSYKLTTYYRSSVKCSFIDLSINEELNPSGTQAIQQTLVQDIFGYTTDIHQLLHSKESFTEMSPKRRREWFIEVSNINYDYAIAVWSKLKDYLRDIQGSLKEHKRRLAEELSSVMSTEEITRIEHEIASIEQSIAFHQTYIDKPSNPNIQEIQTHISKVMTKIQEIRQHLLDTLAYLYKHSGAIPTSDISTYLEELNKEINDTDVKIGVKKAEVDRLKHSLEKASGVLKVDKEKIHAELTDIQSKLVEQTSTSYKAQDRDRLLSLKSRILHWLSARPSVVSKESTDEIEQYRQTLLKEEHDYQEQQESLITMRTTLKVLMDKRKDHLIHCPSCNHAFIPGYNPQEVEDLTQKGKALKESLTQREESLIPKRKHLDDITASYQWRNQLKQIFTELYPEYRYLLKDFNIDHPSLLVERIDQELDQIERYLDQERLLKRQVELNNILSTLEASDLKSPEYYADALEQEERQLYQLNQDRASIHDHIQEILKYIDQKSLVSKHQGSLAKLLEMLSQLELDSIKHQNNQALTTMIENLKITLGDKIKAKSDINNKHRVVQYLEDEIKSLSYKEGLLKLLLDELSPQSGMIAEGLKHFIDIFLRAMNQIIASIWSYPLVVKLPESQEDSIDLDFKFPMQVGLNQESIEDVSLGSSGIKEVINLAFKLTAMKSLKLDHYPLFLDEFGASFDQQHRVSAINIIKTIIEEKIHSQLFLVSHYESSYGALTSTDVSLLSPEIPVPFDKVNTVMQMDFGAFS